MHRPNAPWRAWTIAPLFAIALIGAGVAGIRTEQRPVFAQTLTLTPPTGAPGTVVQLSGSGVTANTAFTLTWDQGQRLADLRSTASGTFTGSFTVPAGATPGPHTVTLSNAPAGATTVAGTAPAGCPSPGATRPAGQTPPAGFAPPPGSPPAGAPPLSASLPAGFGSPPAGCLITSAAGFRLTATFTVTATATPTAASNPGGSAAPPPVSASITAVPAFTLSILDLGGVCLPPSGQSACDGDRARLWNGDRDLWIARLTAAGRPAPAADDLGAALLQFRAQAGDPAARAHLARQDGLPHVRVVAVRHGAAGETDGQWIELRNLGTGVQDLTGWSVRLVGSDAVWRFDDGATLVPDEVCKIALTPPGTTPCPVTTDAPEGAAPLPRDTGTILITSGSGETVDEATYNTDPAGQAPGRLRGIW